MEPRRLVLVRHAQAADAADTPVDADRPLTAFGTERATAIGAWLEATGLRPDRALVSPALRAVQTWEQAGRGAPPVIDPRIYDNTVQALLAAIRDTTEDVHVLAVVGHQPSLGELAAALDDGPGLPVGFPTGGVAVFTLARPFAALAPGTARLDQVTVPGA